MESYIRRKFSQLMPDHIFCDRNVQIVLPVVYLELETDKIREDGSRASLRLDWRNFLARLPLYNWEAVEGLVLGWENNGRFLDSRKDIGTLNNCISWCA